MAYKNCFKNWRANLPVHPAAELFPLMSESELRELGEDIKKHGLSNPVTLWRDDADGGQLYLLDGRNRLDAMGMVGIAFYNTKYDVRKPNGHVLSNTLPGKPGLYALKTDPYAFVLSANINRRHLTADQKRDLIAKVLKAKPDASNRQIAKQVKADDKTVAKVRSDLVSRSEIPNVETRTDTKGRKQPAVKVRLHNGQKLSLDDCSDTVKRQINDAVGATVEVPTSVEQQDLVTRLKASILAIRNIEDEMIGLSKQLTPAQAREIEKWWSEFGDDGPNAWNIIDGIIRDDDKRQRLTKEAKNPQKALDKAREQEQRDEMSDEAEEEKQQCRESGERWSEVKDEWEEDWLANNWHDKREQEFLTEFKESWKRDHQQEFPNSDFAPSKAAA
jgi:hypothetical protein